MTLINPLNNSSQVRSYIQMIEAEDTKQKPRVMNDKQKISEAYNHRLKEFGQRHISKVVAEQLLANNLNVRKWHSILYGFIQKAVEQVRPSSRLLNDSIDINQYIKIKIIDWKDQSKSAYVNGIVMSKNLSDKRMQQMLERPSILLLRNILDSGTIDKANDLQSVIDQEDHLIKLLSSKLQQV